MMLVVCRLDEKKVKENTTDTEVYRGLKLEFSSPCQPWYSEITN
jgi:hypothetical protein